MGQVVSSAKVSDTYHLQKVKLGEGSFGTVWRAVHRRNGEAVAVKQLNKASLPARGIRRPDVEREIKMLGAMKHDNIIRLYETFEDHDSIYIALEYCEGGDFGDKVLERGDNVREPEVAYWVQQMVAAVAYMHAKHICHRDIKPDNYLVAHNNRLKLADLGLAVECPAGRLLTDKCGTPAFMSPEQHELPRRSQGYSLAVDVWAAGICMYMLMCGGRHPFLTARGALNDRNLLAGELDFRDAGFFGRLGLSSRMSDDARRLCQQMVDVDARRRITAADVLTQAWFRHTPAATNEVAAPPPPAAAPANGAASPGKAQAETAPVANGLSPTRLSQKVLRGFARLPALPRRRSSKDYAEPDAAAGPDRNAAVWEFGIREGFQPYQADCHEVLEEQYQAYRNGKGPEVGTVVSVGRHVEVHFKTMLQHVKGRAGRTRRVRRRREEA